MKLPELKKHFKNKYMIRIVAGVLVVAMVGTGAAAYEWSGASMKGAGQTVKTVVENISTKEYAAEDSEKKLTDALNSSLKIDEVDIGKEETVYVISDSNGNVTNTIVSDHLINKEEQSSLKDMTDLSEIENVNGNETFTRDGDQLTWQADGNDIYYQGTTDKETPVTQKVTYYLDGEEITPEELAGKSGKVTIRFDYTNNEKVKTTIAGKEEEICVPFVAMTGIVFDDSFKNIEVSNGKVISDGNNNIVVGYALPGLKDSLNVKDSDFDSDIELPDYFEVTAQVEDFSLEMTMTVAMNATNFISMDSSDATASMDDMLNTLTDATGKLQDGSGDLAEGMDTLKSKMGDFSNGVVSLKDAINAYTDGTVTLNNGIGTLKSGIDTLADNVPALVSGVGQLKTGSDSAAEGAKNLAAGAAQVSEGVNTVAGMLSGMGSTLDATKEGTYQNFAANAGMDYDTAKKTIASLQSAQDNLKEGIKAEVAAAAYLAGGGSKTDEDYLTAAGTANAYYSAVGKALDMTISNAAVASEVIDSLGDKIAALQNGIGQVDGAVQALDGVKASLTSEETTAKIAALTEGATSVAKGASDLSSGVSALQAGITQLNDKAGSLGSGATQLKDGIAQLASGSATLVANNDALNSGAAAVCDATGQLSDGIGTLQDGAHQLSDGMVEFNETGIEKIVNSYNGDIKPLVERMQAVINAGADYQTFTQISDGVNGSVKFIYKTAAVKEK